MTTGFISYDNLWITGLYICQLEADHVQWVEPNRFSNNYATIAMTIEKWTVFRWFHSCPRCAHISAYLLRSQWSYL